MDGYLPIAEQQGVRRMTASWRYGAAALAAVAGGSLALVCVYGPPASGGPDAGMGFGQPFLPKDEMPMLPLDPPDFNFLPSAKRTIKLMDAKISEHVAWDNWPMWSEAMRPFWAEDFVYDTNFCPAEWCPSVSTPSSDKGGPLSTVTSLNNGTGLRSWFDREHLAFASAFGNYSCTQMIFLADAKHASTTSYMQSHWRTDFAGLTRPHAWNETTIITRVFDFYRMDGEKIAYNWMILDLVLYMHQNLAASASLAPSRVVPVPPLKEYFRPPNTLMGGPVPTSKFADHAQTPVSAAVVLAALAMDFGLPGLMTGSLAAAYPHDAPANASVHGLSAPMANLWAPKMKFYGSEGVGTAESEQQFREHILGRLLRTPYGGVWALKPDVFVCEGNFCAVNGAFQGLQTGTFLDVPATGRAMTLRFGMHFRVEGRQIKEAWGLFELPRAMANIGEDLWQRFYDVKGQRQQ